MNKKWTTLKTNILKDKRIVIAIVVALIAVVAIVVAAVLVTNHNKETEKARDEKVTAITEPDVIKDETYEDLKFTNTMLLKEGEYYKLTMEVTNTAKTEKNIESVGANFKDKDGNTLAIFYVYIGKTMKAGETRTITSSAKIDMKTVKSKTIEAWKK